MLGLCEENYSRTTWRYNDDEGDVMPTEQTAIPDDILMDLRHKKMFHFLCEILTRTGYLFKGYYIEEPDVIVERNPRHLRELTELERQNVQRAQNVGGTNQATPSPSRDVDCEGCDTRMSVVFPSPMRGNGEPRAIASPRVSESALVSDCEQTMLSMFAISMTSLEKFDVEHNKTLADLKTAGRLLGLRVTTTGRGIYSSTLPICGRIAFGLKSRAITALKAAHVKAKINLFKFGYHSTTGFYQPSEFCGSIYCISVLWMTSSMHMTSSATCYFF